MQFSYFPFPSSEGTPHKNAENRHTFVMKKLFSRLTLLLCLFPLFLGCQRVHAPVESIFSEEIAPSVPPSEPPTPEPKISNEFWDVSDVDISYIPQGRKLLSLTFDDAPKGTMENILAVFADFNEQNPDFYATATLFCNGMHINPSSRQTLETAVAMGFELGNHTHSHYDLTSLPLEKLRGEIERTDLLLSKIDQKPLHLLRPPFGNCNSFVKENVSVPIINWTIDTLDWTGVSEGQILETILQNCYDGGIALLHDGYINTVNALKRILPALKEKGYQVVSVSAMAKAHDCPLKNGGEYIRARAKSPNRVRVE